MDTKKKKKKTKNILFSLSYKRIENLFAFAISPVSSTIRSTIVMGEGDNRKSNKIVMEHRTEQFCRNFVTQTEKQNVRVIHRFTEREVITMKVGIIIASVVTGNTEVRDRKETRPTRRIIVVISRTNSNEKPRQRLRNLPESSKIEGSLWKTKKRNEKKRNKIFPRIQQKLSSLLHIYRLRGKICVLVGQNRTKGNPLLIRRLRETTAKMT